MWAWDRSVVRPLAHEALSGSVGAQVGEQAGDGVGRVADQGRRMLDRYFEWAPTVDDFVPLRVQTDFEVPFPHPDDARRDLVTPAGEPIHYRGRIDLLVVDGDDNHWLVEHRAGWTDPELLALDQRTASFAWAWELSYLSMRIAGVMFNEVRYDEPSFRRTRVTKSTAELETLRRQMAYEALDMASPDVRVYPNPTTANCTPCAYRAPCLAVNTGHDADPILASAAYRDGGEDDVVEGRLGGVSWSMGRGAAPPKFGNRKEEETRS